MKINFCKKCKAELPPEAVYCHICGTKQSTYGRNVKKRGNGQGSVYKRGDTWVAAIECRAGGIRTVKRKGGFARRKDALEYIASLKERHRDSTIASLWDVYKDNAMLKLSDSKQTAYKIAYKRLEDIRAINMRDLTIETVQACVNKKATSFYTARDMKSLLSHFYKMAMAQQEVSVNLSQFIVLPELNETEPEPFTEAELKKLWKHYETDRWTGYILLMIYTGMMPGELLLCKKDMINLDDRTIIGCGLKTKQRKKTPLMICDIIKPVIKKLLTLSETEFLLDMKRNDFYDKFDETLRAAQCRDLTPYACRHTTATALALGNKVAPAVIKKVMRHANISTTQRYIHPDTKSMLDAVNTFKRS